MQKQRKGGLRSRQERIANEILMYFRSQKKLQGEVSLSDSIETDKEGQFPFNRPYYLLLDMQLGGAWVGPYYTEDLPVQMEIDWVRFYQK